MIVLAVALQAALSVSDAGRQIPPGEKVASFTGDAVVSNGLLQITVKADAVEVAGANGAVHARLKPGGRPALTENAKGGVTLEIPGAVKLRLKRGEVALQVESAGAEKLSIGAPSRFVVLPDFFADDLVIDAAKIPIAAVELPSENFVLNPVGSGDALVVTTFENRDQEVRASVSEGLFTGSEIAFGKQGKIWISVLSGAGTWHSFDVGGKSKLEWTMPFPAQWRCDLTRQDGLTDSWEMLLQTDKNKGYLKPSLLGRGGDTIKSNRERWTTVLGTFKYPCWTDEKGQGYVQPLKEEALTHVGPALIYPLARVESTPVNSYAVVDVMRATLGVGPCENLLDVEGQKNEYKGRATCSVRDHLKKIYSKGEQAEKADEVEKIISDGLAFVKHIRGRIELYVGFGRELGEYLAAQKQAKPELAGPIGELEKLARQLAERYEARREAIKTPDHVAAMNEEFRKNVKGYTGEDAEKRSKKYAEALVEIGDNQDELSGECRWVVKALRQKAGLLMATDPKMAAVAAEVRARTQKVLRNPASHEGAHH